MTEELVSEDQSYQCRAAVEALVLASGEAITIDQLISTLPYTSDEIEAALEVIAQELQERGAGYRLVKIAGKRVQFRTEPEFADYVSALKSGKPRRLSPAALETLAVIAYQQPIVKSDIEKIRGVDATPTLKTLLDRKLVRILGHQATAGQPALYGTTDQFLAIFGMDSLSELPTLRDLREIETDPGEGGGEEQALSVDQKDEAVENTSTMNEVSEQAHQTAA